MDELSLYMLWAMRKHMRDVHGRRVQLRWLVHESAWPDVAKARDPLQGGYLLVSDPRNPTGFMMFGIPVSKVTEGEYIDLIVDGEE